jgi:hypothetical protein
MIFFAQKWRTLMLIVWIAWICLVVLGSLLPAASTPIVALGRLHIHDKAQHFCAYLALAILPVAGFRDRRLGLWAGLAMFVLGVLMEAASISLLAVRWNWEMLSPTAWAWDVGFSSPR